MLQLILDKLELETTETEYPSNIYNIQAETEYSSVPKEILERAHFTMQNHVDEQGRQRVLEFMLAILLEIRQLSHKRLFLKNRHYLCNMFFN